MELTGRDLDRAIAIKLFGADNVFLVGSKPELRRRLPENEQGYPHGNSVPVEWFHADANPQIELCSERGWYISYTGNTALVARDIGGGYNHTHRGDGATPQEAGARAILDALEKL